MIQVNNKVWVEGELTEETLITFNDNSEANKFISGIITIDQEYPKCAMKWKYELSGELVHWNYEGKGYHRVIVSWLV